MSTHFGSLSCFGCGNMGAAVVHGINKANNQLNIRTYTPSYTRAKALADELNGKAYESLIHMPLSDLNLIACKPQQVQELATKLKGLIKKETILISILAGTSIESLVSYFDVKKVVRIMPNTPISVNKGINLICFSQGFEENEKKELLRLFSQGTLAVEVDNQKELDDLTVFSGSGPGYIFEFARLMYDQLYSKGYSSKLSRQVVAQTFLGASTLMDKSELSFEELRNNVTSKGGVTQAALESFHETGLEETLKTAFEKARQRIEILKKG